MKKQLLTLLCYFVVVVVSTNYLHAQHRKDGDATIATADSSIVNRYAQLVGTSNTGDIFITVEDIGYLSGAYTFANSKNIFNTAPLQTGDLLMIIQVQGAQIDTTNTEQFGKILNYNGVGNYELAVVASVSGNTITLCAGLTHTYSTNGTSRAQVVRVPRLNTLFIGGGSTITGKPWNGTSGGVVAFEVIGNSTVNGTISASEIGFKGGVDNPRWGNMNISEFKTNDTLFAAGKGEGIAGNATDYFNAGYALGKGAAANGGGGGNGHNNGGGGGANVAVANDTTGYNGTGIKPSHGLNWCTAWDLEQPNFCTNVSNGGGRGGYSFLASDQDALTTGPTIASWAGDQRRVNGGLGGRVLQNNGTKLFFGGGGGAGDGNNQSSGNGGNGGGIVFMLSYADITGIGFGAIEANGQKGFNTNYQERDAAGGGGGGGSIVITCRQNITNISISAAGGNGGAQIFNDITYLNLEAEGPGGGGGGGFIATTPTSVSLNVAGGASGFTLSNLVTEFEVNGATEGASGLVLPFNRPNNGLTSCLILNNNQLNLTIKQNQLTWHLLSAGFATKYFMVEQSTNGTDFTIVSTLSNTSNNYLNKNSGTIYFRVKAIHANGTIVTSNIVKTTAAAVTTSLQVYPNPASQTITITATSKIIAVTLVDAVGRVLIQMPNTTDSKMVTLNGLSKFIKGSYLLRVYTADGTQTQKVVLQ
jgi:hypothetical protein